MFDNELIKHELYHMYSKYEFWFCINQEMKKKSFKIFEDPQSLDLLWML